MSDPKILLPLQAALTHAPAPTQFRLLQSANANIAALAATPARLQVLDSAALADWNRHWKGHGRFNWPDVMQHLQYETWWFGIALWSGNTLCGLAAGQQARHSAALTLDLNLLEGAPYHHPLRGIVRFYLVDSVVLLARFLSGVHAVRIKDPVNQKVAELYTSLGFDDTIDPPHVVRSV